MIAGTASTPLTTAAEWALIRLGRYGLNSFSSCLLYDDVFQYHCQSVDGFVGYQESRWILVATGEPVCDGRDYLRAAQEFVRFAAAQGKTAAFVAVGQEFVDVVRAERPTTLLLGDDWIFPVRTYAPRGEHAKKVRSASNQLLRHGGIVREYRPSAGRNVGLELQICQMVDRWLATRSWFTMHLLTLNLFGLADLKRYFYVEYEGRPVAILSCLPIFARHGYLFEDLIRDPDAPNGCSELMVLEAIRRFRAEGTQMATFGLSPRLDARSITNLSWIERKIATLGFAAATRLSALHKLSHHRKKFHTGVREPVYLVKFPTGVTVGDICGILTTFHIA
jgi:phosphatidylglycerol lysyltransferase